MRIIYFEPHGDDILLSASKLLQNEHEKLLITFSERPSTGLELHFKNLRSEFLGLPDLNLKYKPKINTYQVNNEFRENSVNVYQKYIRYILVKSLNARENDEEATDDYKHPIPEYYEDEVLKFSPDLVVLPVGLDHPYHVDVSILLYSFVKKNLPRAPIIFYGEKPYVGKRYVSQMFSAFGKLHPECSLVESPLEDPILKERIFKEVYPTEAKMLRFYRSDLVEDPELFYVDYRVNKEELGL